MNEFLRKALSFLIVVTIAISIASCGGDKLRSCDDPQRYQEAVPGKRVESPEGLDDLEPFKELPLPEAAPREPRPAGSPCIELPPQVTPTS